MPVYAVGDIQGCHDDLCRLLDNLGFDDSGDELWLAGDLVNRGPDSAKTIRLVKSLHGARVVLGNHDLHLLAVARGFRPVKPTDTFADILHAPDGEELLEWLRTRPLLFADSDRRSLLVHAGVHPDWSIERAICLAREVEALLRDDDACPILLQRMYGNSPSNWSESLDRFDRGRWIINAFTRMRFCTPGGEMDFRQVGPPGSQPAGLHPWYELQKDRSHRIFFGHWSLLGAGVHGNAISLDSGCAHGGRLTAVNLDDQVARFIQVSCRGRRRKADSRASHV